MNENKSFMDLEAWQKCRDLRRKTWMLCKTFPEIEVFRLSDQMIRASRSATANIAEGYGRFNYQENIQYCRMSRGSLHELRDHLSTAEECNYISNEEYNSIDALIISCLRLTNGYINYLIRQKRESK